MTFGIFVPKPDTHNTTQTCKQLSQWRENKEAAQKQAEAESVRFYVNGGEIKRLTTFRYLGRLLAEDNDDTACLRAQIKRVRARWNSVAQALKQDGADVYVIPRFYLVIVRAILLYRANLWIISARNMEVLKLFHKRAIRHIMGCHI